MPSATFSSATRRTRSPESAAATKTAGPPGCTLRAGRLAGPRQPDAQPRPCATSTTSTCATPQPAVVGGLRDAGRPIRHRRRRASPRSTRTRRRCCPLIPIPYVTSARGRLGSWSPEPQPGRASLHEPGSRWRWPTRARSSAAVTASSSTSGPTACRPPSRAICRSSTHGKWTCRPRSWYRATRPATFSPPTQPASSARRSWTMPMPSSTRRRGPAACSTRSFPPPSPR